MGFVLLLTVMFGGDQEWSQVFQRIGKSGLANSDLITELFVSLKVTDHKIDSRRTDSRLN